MTCSIVLVWDFGSVLSAFGLFEQHKMSTVDSFHVDEQQSIYEPLNHIDLENASGQQEVHKEDEYRPLRRNIRLLKSGRG
ncbi:hypothetical protein Tco_0921263 [Tanacetum coccineum]